MNVLFAFLNSGAAVGAAIWELLQYGWRFLKNLFLPKVVLAPRVLAAESQLALCQERLESCRESETGCVGKSSMGQSEEGGEEQVVISVEDWAWAKNRRLIPFPSFDTMRLQ